jgi:hypothetical protein
MSGGDDLMLQCAGRLTTKADHNSIGIEPTLSEGPSGPNPRWPTPTDKLDVPYKREVNWAREDGAERGRSITINHDPHGARDAAHAHGRWARPVNGARGD